MDGDLGEQCLERTPNGFVTFMGRNDGKDIWRPEVNIHPLCTRRNLARTFEAGSLGISIVCVGSSYSGANEELVVEQGVGDMDFFRRHTDNGTLGMDSFSPHLLRAMMDRRPTHHIFHASPESGDSTVQVESIPSRIHIEM